MWMLLRVLLLVAGILVVNFHLALRQGEFTAPISVTLEGLPDDELAGRADARILCEHHRRRG